MAKITRKQVDDINARLLNGWKFNTRHFILNGEKSVTMEIPLDEKYELSASISFYDSYECFEKISTVVKIRVSKWENIGNGMISSCDWGKSRAITYTKPRKMFKDIEILTAFITKEDIMEIYNGTEETAEIANIRMNSKGLWERVRENSEPMPEAVAETTPETGNLKPTKKRINALQQIVKANKEENRVAIQTEKAQFFGNGFMFVMLVASCFITPISEFFSNVADGFHHMARTFMNTVKAAEAETGEKLQLPTLQELKEIKRVCKLNDGKSIVDFGEKMPCVNADFLKRTLESLSGKVEAWERGKYNIYLKDEYGNTAYIMGIQLKPEVKREFWGDTLERNRKLEEELRKQEEAEKQENSVEESAPTTKKPTSTEEQPENENPKGESIMNDNSIMFKYNTEEQPEEPKTAWAGRADYAERRAEKAERYAECAEKARKNAERLQKPINDMHGDVAFFTQPNINTSAGRAFTRQREKMFASYEKGFEERAKAAYYDEKSENFSKEPTAISSDDPEALRKLKDKLEKLTAEHKEHLAHNKALNKAIKDGTAETNKFGWATLNGKSYYFTTNEAAEIRRLKDRIEELENLEVPENYSFDGGTVVFNTSENRVQILFDEIPDSETRENLKRNGFKWSPRQQAWQRMLNTTGIRTVKRLYPMPEKPTEENSVEVETANSIEETSQSTTENIVYPFILVGAPTTQPETAEESPVEEQPVENPVIETSYEKCERFIKKQLTEKGGMYTELFWDLAEKSGLWVRGTFGTPMSKALCNLAEVENVMHNGKIAYSVFKLKVPYHETPEEKSTFFSADLAGFIAKRTLAYDEREDMAYPLFEKGYTEKHKPSEKALFGYHLSEIELYTLAEKYHNGEDINVELAKKLLNHGEEEIEIVFDNGKITDKTYHFKKEMCRKLHTEYVENGVDCRFGESDRLITFEEIGKAFIEICRDEYNDILEWREQEDSSTENQTAEPPIETITVEDTEIAVEKIPEVILEYRGDSEKLAILKDKALSLGASVSSTENHLTIDTYENHRPEIESVATELGLKTDEEMHETFSTVQGKINEVGTIEQKNIIYKIPWGIYRRYSAEDIINMVLAKTNDILAIKTENRLKAVSALIDSVAPMTTDKLISNSMEKSGATAEQIAQAKIAIQYIGSPDKLNDYVCSTEENSADNSTANSNKATAERKIRPPPFLKDFPKI